MNYKAISWSAIMAILVGGVVARLRFDVGEVLAHGDDPDIRDHSYVKLPRSIDREQRNDNFVARATETVCDVAALTGMPDGYKEALSTYTEEVLIAIRASPIKRRRFYHRENNKKAAYPLDVNPIYDRDVRVPIVILPRPNVVTIWSDSAAAKAVGWHSAGDAFRNRGSVYGRTLVFNPGAESRKPVTTPAMPYGVSTYPSVFLYGNVFIESGKIVDSPRYDPNRNGSLRDVTAPLLFGREGGATVLGEFLTIPACLENPRLRWVFIREGKESRQFLAYSLVDGNGPSRIGANRLTRNRISSFVRPLICTQHQPRILQHDELLLPTPLGWPATVAEAIEGNIPVVPHEEWCLDDWFPAQKEACWVIREADDSSPLLESFLLMPATEESDRPVFCVALFAETEPKQLVKELAALYKVSADKALNFPEIMERLQSLYEKVRDFPLDE